MVQVRYTDEILSFSAFDRCAVRVVQMKFGCGCLSFDQKNRSYTGNISSGGIRCLSGSVPAGSVFAAATRGLVEHYW